MKIGKTNILAIVLLSVILTGGIIYLVTGSKYKAALEEKDETIALAQSTVAELQQATSKVTPQGTKSIGTGSIDCNACHDTEQTKGFHYVENIKLLDESRGDTPKICSTCHGSSPHTVHRQKLSDGEMQCESCHMSSEGDYVIPQIPDGKLLVCEACHAFSGKPEDVGNYISIHIEEGNKNCQICHMGDTVKVHKAATADLGLVDGRVYTTVK